MKLLIITRQQKAAEEVRRNLEAAGHSCIAVEDTPMAETLMKSNPFDLVLSAYLPDDSGDEPHVLTSGDLRMDLDTHRVTHAGRPVELQPREYQLLEYMLRHPGRVLTRNVILTRVWNCTIEPLTNVVESCVSRLRTKLGDIQGSRLIKTIKGFGYKLEHHQPRTEADPADPADPA